jgi:hypothetical protein
MGSKTKVVEIELRNSERQSFTTCPQQWDWGYNDRLKPKTPAPALRFGTLIHNSLEAFYIPGIKRGPIPADTFQKLYDKDLKKYAKMGFKDEDDQWYEAGVLGVAMLEAYFDKYGERPQNAAGQYLNKPTKADLLKFAADTGKKPPKDKSFSSMTVDELCKRFGDSALQLGEISKTQPSPLFHREPVYRDEYDKGMARSRIIAQARMMHYMRTNPHCKWCPYKDPCEIHEMGGDYKAIFKSMYETWEPYAQHEIEDGEKR